MPSFLFWLFAIVMLVFGALVVINRNPIASALSLVVCFLGLAALFMSLDAFFIGIIQVLVYAGAVMVLFLFIIMLLDLRAEERRTMNWVVFTGGFVVAFSLLVFPFSPRGRWPPQLQRADPGLLRHHCGRRRSRSRPRHHRRALSRPPHHPCRRHQFVKILAHETREMTRIAEKTPLIWKE